MKYQKYGPGDPFYAPKFIQEGRVLAAMMDYPRLNAHDTPYFVQGPKSLAAGDKCDYVGCNKPHGHAYKWQRRGEYGMGWRISYFCSQEHMNLAIREASK